MRSTADLVSKANFRKVFSLFTHIHHWALPNPSQVCPLEPDSVYDIHLLQTVFDYWPFPLLYEQGPYLLIMEPHFLALDINSQTINSSSSEWINAISMLKECTILKENRIELRGGDSSRNSGQVKEKWNFSLDSFIIFHKGLDIKDFKKSNTLFF